MIARGSQASERHVASGSGRRAVEVHDAGADAIDETVPVLRIVRHQSRREAIARGVSDPDGVVKGGHAGDRQEGGEDFFVRHLDAGDVDDGGRHEGVGQALDPLGGADHLRPGVDARLQGQPRALGRADRDQRPTKRFRGAVPGRIGQPPGDGVDGLDDGVALRPLRHDQAARARASLAGGDEGGHGHDPGHGLGVGGVPDHQRIIATQLQRQDHVRIIGELAPEMRTGRTRAGEH